MNMKKIAICLLAGLLLVSLCACGSKVEADTNTPATAAPAASADSEPVDAETAPEAGTDEPADAETAPEAGTDESADAETAPEAGTDEPADAETAPEAGTDESADTETAPEAGDDEPADIETAPVADDDELADAETAPVVDDEPVACETAPAMDFTAYVGDWHDAVSGRARMTVTLIDGNPYFDVIWPDSAFASYIINFLAAPDDQGGLTYDAGFKGIVEYDSDGNETKTILDDVATGTVVLTENGTLIWTEDDQPDNPHEFVKD